MTADPLQAEVVVGREGGAPEEVADLTEQLRLELLESGIADVRRPQRSETPVGAKGDIFAWAELIVTLTGSLPALVAAIRSWVERGSGRSVTLELSGDRLEVSGISSAEQERLISEWLERQARQDG